MSTRFEDLAIDQLAVHPKNVRKAVGIVTDLANSISSQGIMQPLVVAPDLTQQPDEVSTAADMRYTIIAGHRRHAAAQLANLDVLPCVIRADLDTEPKQLEAMLVENTQRTDLTLMEEARAYQAILDFPGYNLKTVSKAVGRSQKVVKDRAKLATIPDAAAEKLEAKQMTIEEALVFAEFAGDDEATQLLLGYHGSYNWEWSVKSVREQRQVAALISESTTKLSGLGATLMERPEDLHSRGAEWESARSFSEFEDFTTEQHIAAGHSAVVDTRTAGRVLWLIPADQAPERPVPTTPELTPEQLADQEKREAMKAGLRIAAEVRHEYLRSKFLSPTPAIDEHVRQMRIKQLVKGLHVRELSMYLNLPEDSKPAAVKASLEDLTTDQLDALQLIAGTWYSEQELLSHSGWGPTKYGSDYAKGWRELVVDVFGYQLSDVEREAIAYVADQRAKEEELQAAAPDDDDSDDAGDDDWEDDDDA
ncbi:ParB/RepB/Spo0J family partition protein [Pseudarthrobacter sp. J64]|uniref:ParB/RepB/Spo0J family partition protein n=1 Tax=Pseudarthrobacter sp. J64 TaxID=3116485 RepID=UPI002E81583D|nr:ParB/RepB/Spo0J family partition protein [Pseudarthrobacter sp. J64]MEE2568585.1 ParB/RepB/Spo0J family partition protein [Pseudarthrobacter sp. J64]